ncbi:hypothetical protein CCP4SC76_6940001 [Gammaproteobacteria bacterium]
MTKYRKWTRIQNFHQSPILGLAALFGLVVAIILGGSYGSFRFFADQLIKHAQEDLQGLARMKAERIRDQLDDIRIDAKVFIARPSVWKTLMAINMMEESLRLTRDISNTLQNGHNYCRLLVVDKDFQVIAPAGSQKLGPRNSGIFEPFWPVSLDNLSAPAIIK